MVASYRFSPQQRHGGEHKYIKVMKLYQISRLCGYEVNRIDEGLPSTSVSDGEAKTHNKNAFLITLMFI